MSRRFCVSFRTVPSLDVRRVTVSAKNQRHAAEKVLGGEVATGLANWLFERGEVVAAVREVAA